MSAGHSRRLFVTRIAGLGALAVVTACGGQMATAQPAAQRKHRIGYLAPRLAECEDPNAWQVAAAVAIKIGESLPATSGCQAATLVATLAERGYRQGENVEFIIAGPPQFGAAEVGLFVPPARELVARRVDIIVTVGEAAPLAAKQATSTIPIVAYRVGNFVENGIVSNIARPGGNVTGVSLHDTAGKRLELLRDGFPSVKHAMLVYGPTALDRFRVEREVDLARSAGMLTTPVLWGGQAEPFTARAKAAIETGADSVVVLLGTARPPEVLTLIREHRLPAVGGGLAFADSGCVVGLSTPGQIDPFAADYIDRVLNGANPGDLPVIYTTAFVVYVNLKLAAELGVTVSPSVVSRAAMVIK